MNARTAQQIENLKMQSIGVEVEMNNITRDRAARIAAEFFGTRRYENTAGRNGYCTWSTWDVQGREWKFQKDISIAGCDSEKCEMVTPILNYSDIETLQELVRKLRKAGAVSHAGVGAGVHIHIGANGHTPQTLRNLANIMASHEQLIADALKIDKGRINRYCRTVNPRFIEQLNKKKPTTMAQLADIWYESNGSNYDGTIDVTKQILPQPCHCGCGQEHCFVRRGDAHAADGRQAVTAEQLRRGVDLYQVTAACLQCCSMDGCAAFHEDAVQTALSQLCQTIRNGNMFTLACRFQYSYALLLQCRFLGAVRTAAKDNDRKFAGSLNQLAFHGNAQVRIQYHAYRL